MPKKKRNIMCCNSTCIDIVALVIATFSLAVNGCMLWVMVKQLVPEIKNLQHRLDNTLERTKKSLIYSRHFPDRSIDEKEFEAGVVNTYKDLLRIIPDLTEQGYRDEDWYLGEWLCRYRKDQYPFLADKKCKCEVAKEISTIRRRNASEL